MGAQPLNDSLYRIVGRMIGLSLAHGGSLAIAHMLDVKQLAKLTGARRRPLHMTEYMREARS